MHFHDSVTWRIRSFQADWTPLLKTIFEKISHHQKFFLFFEKECISMVVFLGESGHSESVGPPFKNHFLKKFLFTQNFSKLFLEKMHFHDSVSRRIRSFRVDWTPLSKTIFWKYNPWGLFWAPPRGPLGTRILVNFFLHCQALPSGPETAAKPSLLICSRFGIEMS